jgi:MFS family permease
VRAEDRPHQSIARKKHISFGATAKIGVPDILTGPLANKSFRYLFTAQICSLLGVGLLTVALSLLAFRIGGTAGGSQVLGLVLALKMIAYVFLAPLAETLTSGLPRKKVLVSLDFGRMLLLLPMAFASEAWEMIALALAFFALSAGFTPLYQSVIPDVLTDENDYSRALSWSRIAYTLEAVLSPVIAATLLNIVTGEALFYAAAIAFFGSVLALTLAHMPRSTFTRRSGSILKRTGFGLWIHWQTPRLRGLVLLKFALSLAMAWVLVNSVVYAGARLGDADQFYPILMACYGAGAVLGAILVPKMLHQGSERTTMFIGTFGFALAGAAFAMVPPASLPVLSLIWFLFGTTSSLTLTPGGLVIARSATAQDRPAVFAAQFSVSHAGWMIAYPLAGWLAGHTSLEFALLILSILCALFAVAALFVWPANDPKERYHSHPELPTDHPHLMTEPGTGTQHWHIHTFRIDELHPTWRQGAN